MAEKPHEFPKTLAKRGKNITTQPLEMWGISSQIAHEPGSTNQELAWIEDKMAKLKVGESVKWTTDGEKVLTITKVDNYHYTLKYPEDYEE